MIRLAQIQVINATLGKESKYCLNISKNTSQEVL